MRYNAYALSGYAEIIGKNIDVTLDEAKEAAEDIGAVFVKVIAREDVRCFRNGRTRRPEMYYRFDPEAVSWKRVSFDLYQETYINMMRAHGMTRRVKDGHCVVVTTKEAEKIDRQRAGTWRGAGEFTY